jgi:hypothetical protein
MLDNNSKLIFVYNADSNVISLVKDFWHKLLRPSTYQCRLCGVTYGVFGMKREWKKFIRNLSINVEFLHRDEFEDKYDIKDAQYPSAFINEEGRLRLLISAEEMNLVNSLDEMESLIFSKLNNFKEITI